MTHYTTALTGDKPICGSESEDDLWTSDIELTDCPKCLKIFYAPNEMHAILKVIADAFSKRADEWTGFSPSDRSTQYSPEIRNQLAIICGECGSVMREACGKLSQ